MPSNKTFTHNLNLEACANQNSDRNLTWDDNITINYIINDISGRTGYIILEVDFEYPKELQDLHIDYPFAPEVMKVKSNMLSEKQAEICKLTNGSKEPEE